MKTTKWILACLILLPACMNESLTTRVEGIKPDWQILKKYENKSLHNISLPVGGIGTGTISFGGRGDLRDWELMNRPAKGYVPAAAIKPFFAFSAGINGERVVRLLEGPIGLDRYAGYFGSEEHNHGLPRFPESSFWATYPFGQVNLADPGIPLTISVESFNPFVPVDADMSGMPVMVLTYKIRNNSAEPMTLSVCGNIPNFIGNDGYTNETRMGNGLYQTTGERDNRNEYREDSSVEGIYMYSDGVDSLSPAWGTLALVTAKNGASGYRTNWISGYHFESLAEYWEDFMDDGIVTETKGAGRAIPVASLSVTKEIAPGSIEEFRFYITWHFPNRQTWTPIEGENNRIGNYYCTKYQDAWDAATQIVPQIPNYRERTVEFVNAFCESSYPESVKEAALFNLTALRSETSFRTPDGYFHGYEGCFDRVGCCFGNCTHVWNYEVATPYLFGELSKKRRVSEFLYATNADGLMSFRMGLPMEERGKQYGYAAADGQMGCLMKLYRDWQLSGDDEFLREVWPSAKKALSFAWVEGGWDEDADGVMEGCQHNTMDVSYFGPNPQMMFWYMGALRSAELMARYLGDTDFAGTCARLYTHGSKLIDEQLFNGEYYIQKIIPSPPKEEVFPGLYHHEALLGMEHPNWQIGEGCLVDQLVGQYMAHICGLGYLADSTNIGTTLRSIMRYNYRDNLFNHFNNRRSYALGHESALLMVDYPPHVTKEENPFIYATETMTGFEYTAAVGMIYEGQVENGLKCIQNIRDRFDGIKRNPFDEAEAGHHYARAMASWSALLALSGFQYSAIDGEIRFDFLEGTNFWSNGYAFGTVTMDRPGEAEMNVLGGEISISKFTIINTLSLQLEEPVTLRAGDYKRFAL